MKLTISYPSHYQAKERFNRLTFEDNQDRINININGTNFDSLQGFLNDLDEKNKVSIKSYSNLTIDDYRAIARQEIIGKSIPKIYYIYVDYSVYTLSTSSPALYDDLDQIAKSFKYAP